MAAYEKTTIDYMKSQIQLGKILTDNKIYDKVFFDKQSEKQIWLVFKYDLKIEDKTIPIGVKIVLPNITEKNKNQKFRLLYWYIKSKFEAINECLFEDINTTFIKEFYPHMLVGDKTIYESLAPQLNKAMIEGKTTTNKLELDFKNE